MSRQLQHLDVALMWYFEDEARGSSVTSRHLLKQDGVDAQTGGRVGRLTQQPGGQTGKQETGSVKDHKQREDSSE